ncbi:MULTISPECIES: hypothetical protein [Streptomyces]|uniref:Uncharacterized protein n=1 Tax=Streptomyces dengpaensis TaxID=2049881 RepID=A0ABN5HZM9_9ACTN|nr:MULTISPECIES: hypothetical protein [Streptomyces]AVH56444.1 hypothetical protein C4B68_12395 [Streptomyces dengpaensis]PIB10529.1 hypothetical protein B1C81_08700 [Streptomyces sp. HG99]
MFVRRRPHTLLVGLAAAALLAGTAGVAGADAAPAPTPAGDAAEVLCKKVPKIDRRIDRALKRLDAGVGTRGSVARLERRVDNAKKVGHDEIATYLQGRLDFRKSLVPTLQERKEDLADVKTWCEDNGNGAEES